MLIELTWYRSLCRLRRCCVTPLVALLLAGFSPSLWASKCAADVENTRSKLSGHSFFATWHIVHNAPSDRFAHVYFDYRIHYRNRRGTTLVETGVLNEAIRGASAQITKENTLTLDPVEVLAVEFGNLNCHY